MDDVEVCEKHEDETARNSTSDNAGTPRQAPRRIRSPPPRGFRPLHFDDVYSPPRDLEWIDNAKNTRSPIRNIAVI
jgi:hypothetical protein